MGVSVGIHGRLEMITVRLRHGTQRSWLHRLDGLVRLVVDVVLVEEIGCYLILNPTVPFKNVDLARHHIGLGALVKMIHCMIRPTKNLSQARKFFGREPVYLIGREKWRNKRVERCGLIIIRF
jgi:hypothetical protein